MGDNITINELIEGLDTPDSAIYRYFSGKSSALPEVLSMALK
jgi:hypothetical protein